MTTDAYRDPPQTQQQILFGRNSDYRTTINGVHVFRSRCFCGMCRRVWIEVPEDYMNWAAMVAMRHNKEKNRTMENFHYIRHALLMAAFEDFLEES